MKGFILFSFLIICGLQVSAQATTDTTLIKLPNKELTTFIKAVNIAGLNLTNKTITIFAPDNQAFDSLSPGKLDTLFRPANKLALISLLNSHIVEGKITSQDIAKLIHANNGVTTFTTLAGSKLTAKVNANRNIVLVDESGAESIIKTFNISQGNAEIFIVSRVISSK
jgi:uncharacterized surface protein with fasciclin (FAS1) repeats